jgi:hypothetical protein
MLWQAEKRVTTARSAVKNIGKERVRLLFFTRIKPFNGKLLEFSNAPCQGMVRSK